MQDLKKHSKQSQEEDNFYQAGNDESAASLEEVIEVNQILEKLEPEEQRVIATMFSGPLPPPEILKGYAEVFPEAPEKIFAWVEEQQSHRHHMEEKHMNNFFRQSTIGIISGFLIALVFIIGGITLIIMDKEVIGLSIMAPVIISIVGLFITRRRKENAEEEDQKETKE